MHQEALLIEESYKVMIMESLGGSDEGYRSKHSAHDLGTRFHLKRNEGHPLEPINRTIQ
jgi:hypothetical protein